jgi:hypothetical protein
VQTHSNYLLAVFPPVAPSLASASATVRHFAARATSALPAEVTKVSILDLDNKLVAYSGTFPDGVREAVSVWGNVYVLSEDGEVGSYSATSNLCMCTHDIHSSHVFVRSLCPKS